MQNDICTLQEQFGFLTLSTLLFSVGVASVSIRHYKHKIQTIYDLHETLCESLAAEMSVKMSSLDFSPKLNWVKYKLDVLGFV